MMRKCFFAATLLVTVAPQAMAQDWRWSGDDYYRSSRGRTYYVPPPPTYYREPLPSPYYRAPPTRYISPYRPGANSFLDDDEPRRRPPVPSQQFPKLADGGPRPEIEPIGPQSIRFQSRYAPGTIIIDTAGRQLLLTQANGIALRYPISVGREGFTWTGEEKISRIAEWPDWHPPAEMRERDPKLPEKMTGGLRNPLGAKALYLGNTLYRIHGTNDARTIGRASSSGCFRMLNGHVVDLSERVGVGTKVVVVSNLRVAESRRGRDG